MSLFDPPDEEPKPRASRPRRKPEPAAPAEPPDEHAAAPGAPARSLTVTELVLQAKQLLQGAFPSVRVSGEISNFHLHGSGHMYFSLKDAGAILPCAMFRGSNQRLRFKPRDGMQAEACGRLTLYEGRGQYQLVVEALSESGVGALQQRFEELKARLLAEGLFDESRKRPLPRFPERLGVVTSPTGAVIHDILRVARRRWPAARVILAPVKVQGEGSAEEIAAAIERFNRLDAADVLIVGRGGGSLEDLWAFNEESVVRAVAGSRLPVISAVGHETDFTLCDFAADLRAPTPSVAAERAVPDRLEFLARVAGSGDRMRLAVLQGLERRRQRVRTLAGSYALGRPRELLSQRMQQVDDLRHRLGRGVAAELRAGRERVARAAARLRALSPDEVLKRGFAYARRTADGVPVDSVARVSPGDGVDLVFADGRAGARIETVSGNLPATRRPS